MWEVRQSIYLLLSLPPSTHSLVSFLVFLDKPEHQASFPSVILAALWSCFPVLAELLSASRPWLVHSIVVPPFRPISQHLVNCVADKSCVSSWEQNLALSTNHPPCKARAGRCVCERLLTGQVLLNVLFWINRNWETTFFRKPQTSFSFWVLRF